MARDGEALRARDGAAAARDELNNRPVLLHYFDDRLDARADGEVRPLAAAAAARLDVAEQLLLADERAQPEELGGRGAAKRGLARRGAREDVGQLERQPVRVKDVRGSESNCEQDSRKM